MKFDWTQYRGNLDWLQSNTIFLTVYGSHAFGLATPESDLDTKGVAIPPMKYFTGWLNRFEQAESKDPDLCIYDIRKFFHLATDCNPNVIEMLFVDESDILQISPLGKKIRHFRKQFLSKKAQYTYSGYAIAQLKRIKTHKKWLLNPPTHKPERVEFNLPNTSLLSSDIMGAIESLEAKNAPMNFSSEVMEAYKKERSHHNALREWQQYENWKKTRNPKRAVIEAQHGYDCKHAMHLVRLMRMCEEILTTGEVIVKRPDREELLAVRNGAWTYDQLMVWAETQDAKLKELAVKSSLPHSPDRIYLDTICCSIVEEFHERSTGKR